MTVELDDSDRDYLRSLLWREWHYWDKGRTESQSHREYSEALNRQTRITELLERLSKEA